MEPSSKTNRVVISRTEVVLFSAAKDWRETAVGPEPVANVHGEKVDMFATETVLLASFAVPPASDQALPVQRKSFKLLVSA